MIATIVGCNITKHKFLHYVVSAVVDDDVTIDATLTMM